jgi:hypothetical protein
VCVLSARFSLELSEWGQVWRWGRGTREVRKAGVEGGGAVGRVVDGGDGGRWWPVGTEARRSSV